MAEVIKKELPEKELKKLEHDLFFTEGMSIKLSMEHYGKFQSKLKSVIHNDAKTLSKKYLNKIINFKAIKDGFTIKILDDYLIQKILDYWGDPESREILSLLMDAELTAPEILSKVNIAKTSAYRKLENMVIDGIIIETKKVLSESKKVSKHRCIFDQINIKFGPGSISVTCNVSKNLFNNSTIAKNIFP